MGGEGEGGDLVSVNVRCSNGSKFSVSTSLDSTVEAFKELVAQNSEVPANQQRLIYKGRILKDDQSLLSYGLQADHTVHMVRGSAPSPAPATTQTTAPGVTRGVGSNDTSIPGLGFNPLGGGNAMSGLFGADLEQAQQQLAQNPNMIRDMMNTPAIQSLMNNPEFMRSMIMSNPQMRDLVDRNPELGHVLNDPSILRQTLEAARNPELMREMMRNTDRAMSNIESMPEGFNHLRRMYENVQEKDMMDELKRKQFNKEWCGPIEASCSSQATTNDDIRRWNVPSFPSVSVVEDNGHSPMKGISSQGVVLGQVPWQNGASSRHVETLEVRPTKIRKKMIDLCIPADEYIDDSEDVIELKDHRVSQLPNGAEPRGDSFRIGYGSSSRTNGLADLNEPFKAQETNEVAYGNFQSHVHDYGKVLNSGSVREHVPANSLQPDENGKPKAWPQQHQPLRIDPYTGTHKSATPFIQPGKPLDSSSQSMQVLMNGSQRVMGLPNAGPPPSKADFWRGKTFIDLEADDTDTNTSHEVIHGSSFASHQPRHLYPYNPTPDSAVPWNRLHSSWQNPSFGFPQRAASAQRYPVLNLSDTNSQKLGGLGDRLQFESNPRYNSGCGTTTRPNQNMFYNECSSSSKSKFSGTGYNYLNGGRSDYCPGNAVLDLNGSEVKSVRDLNLNVTLSNSNDEEHLATLPWLVKPKSACNDGRWSNDAVPSSSLKPSNIKKEEGGNSVQNLMWLERLKSGSCSSKPETEKINAGTAHRDESNAERDKVHRIMVDINEPCEPLSDEDQQIEKQTKFHIDLNMSVSEDEEDDNRSVPTSSKLISRRPMIDLETVPESDVEEEPSEETPTEEKNLEKPPEFEKTAAETIVAISSACLDRELEAVASSPEAAVILHWFAETVDTHRENLDQKLASSSRNQARSIEEIDYFESMTLQLPEITEEEYMPTPLVPEDLVLEETSVATSHQRPRRGNARKGKQRRDFQRDILPGLLSLSKHEVTEDIQMFDGFMRATGRSWTPTGLTRKKTGARGRPRRVITNPEPVVYYPVSAPCPSVQQHVGNQSSNGEIEMGFEDGSFGGWGKMTRRPRRQRCPSSSNVTASVTNVHHHTRMSRDGWE